MKFFRAFCVIFLFANTSCGAQEIEGRAVKATYCISVDVQSDTASKNLLFKLDEFAVRNSLEIDSTNPISRRYSRTSKSSVIYIAGHMGPAGTIISFFPFGEDKESLLTALKQFSDKEINGLYQVKECKLIDGFQYPTIYL